MLISFQVLNLSFPIFDAVWIKKMTIMNKDASQICSVPAHFLIEKKKKRSMNHGVNYETVRGLKSSTDQRILCWGFTFNSNNTVRNENAISSTLQEHAPL